MRPRENLYYVKRGFKKGKLEEGSWPFPSKQQAVCAVSAGEEVRRLRRVYHATLNPTKYKQANKQNEKQTTITQTNN